MTVFALLLLACAESPDRFIAEAPAGLPGAMPMTEADADSGMPLGAVADEVVPMPATVVIPLVVIPPEAVADTPAMDDLPIPVFAAAEQPLTQGDLAMLVDLAERAGEDASARWIREEGPHEAGPLGTTRAEFLDWMKTLAVYIGVGIGTAVVFWMRRWLSPLTQ